jgi:hypothetical protein
MTTQRLKKLKPAAGLKRENLKVNNDEAQEWGRFSCVLKLKTIEALRAGAGDIGVGEFLEWILERHSSIPTHDQYLRWKDQPVIIGESGPPRDWRAKPRKRRLTAAEKAANTERLRKLFASKKFAAKLRALAKNDGHRKTLKS